MCAFSNALKSDSNWNRYIHYDEKKSYFYNYDFRLVLEQPLVI
jgi:hypothetical protein